MINFSDHITLANDAKMKSSLKILLTRQFLLTQHMLLLTQHTCKLLLTQHKLLLTHHHNFLFKGNGYQTNGPGCLAL